jgi:hypothetical protein
MSRPTERPALKLAFRLCLGPYRHLAQFVFYPNCKHGSCLNLSYMQMQLHVLLEEDDAILRELVPVFSRDFLNPREQSAHLN